MNKTAVAAVAGAAGTLALVAAVGGGYLAGHHSTSVRTEVRTVTVTRTAPPKVITRWKTKTVTVTQTATAAAPAGMACSMVNSGFLVAGNPGGNSTPDGTCQVALYGNGGNGSVKLSDGSGHVTWYDLGAPSASGG